MGLPKCQLLLQGVSLKPFPLPNGKISDVHGQAIKVRGRLVVAMYHPAAALHQRSLRPIIEADFARLPGLITEAEKIPEYEVPTPNEENKQEPKQLSLF